MRDFLVVALGGALGCGLRYFANFWLAPGLAGSTFPPTLILNVLGSFAIGLVAAVAVDRGLPWYFLSTGLLGGFTTYSAFSLETVRMLQGRQVLQAVVYVVLTTVLCLVMCWVGLKVGALAAAAIGRR